MTAGQRLLDQWVALCAPVEPVSTVRAEALIAGEFTMLNLWRTVRLDLDEVSWPDPQDRRHARASYLSVVDADRPILRCYFEGDNADERPVHVGRAMLQHPLHREQRGV